MKITDILLYLKGCIGKGFVLVLFMQHDNRFKQPRPRPYILRHIIATHSDARDRVDLNSKNIQVQCGTFTPFSVFR